MPYAIFRIAKLKSPSQLSTSERHTWRLRETPNADLSRINERLLGSSDFIPLSQLVSERIGSNGGRKIRKNAVLAVEMLLTASPEFFRPSIPSHAGSWDADVLERWKQTNLSWLLDNFGDRIVRTELHLDESTPHIHAYFVPIDERGHLNCRGFFGSRKLLSRYQDCYALAMKPLGLSRGIKGSQATHTSMKEYYAAVNLPPDASLSPSQVHSQLADRRRALKEKHDLRRTVHSLSSANTTLMQQQQLLREDLLRQKHDTEKLKTFYRAYTDQLRTLPLESVALELGLEPHPRDRKKWRSDSHIINITGSQFFDFRSEQGGGGAIDLVMHVQGGSFSSALAWLRDHFGEGAALHSLHQQSQAIASIPPQKFVPPSPHQMHWSGVVKYLTLSRLLPKEIVNTLHHWGLLYADKYSNAVFLRRSFEGEVTGAFLRGTTGNDNSFKGLAPGSRRSLGWFYFVHGGTWIQDSLPLSTEKVHQAVLTESAIDALSYSLLYPPSDPTLFLSTDGTGSIPFSELKQFSQITIAFDRDSAGDDLASRVLQQLPQARRHFPSLKDWNMDLCRAQSTRHPLFELHSGLVLE